MKVTITPGDVKQLKDLKAGRGNGNQKSRVLVIPR